MSGTTSPFDGYVFISHASEDAAAAQQICDALERGGVRCWIAERDIRGGVAWNNEGIVPGLEGAQIVLLVWSQHAERKHGYVRDELRLARKYQRSVLRFQIEDRELSDEFDLEIGGFQALKGYPPPLEEHIDRLVEELRFHLAPSDAPATAGDDGPTPGSGGQTLGTILRLPRRNRRFVARESEMSRIEETLRRGDAILALLGPPGFGKTQLALEYAYEHVADYEVVAQVGSEGADALRRNFAALAEALGLGSQRDETATIEAIRATLPLAGRWLLIFDNVESPSDVAAVLPDGGGDVLITSQHRGWGELGASVLEVPAMSSEEATELLLKRTGRHDTEAARQVAELLEKSPLALEQAAAFVDNGDVPWAEFLEMIREDSINAFEAGAPSNYPRTLQAAWRLAFSSLSPEAAEVIKLAAFLDPDDIPARDLNLIRSAVHELVASSLGRRTQADAFSVHRTGQVMARAQLTEPERRQWAAIAMRALQITFPDDPTDVLVRPLGDRLLPHALAALDHARELGVDAPERARLLDAVGLFHVSRARFSDAATAFDEALALPVSQDDPSLRGELINHRGVLSRELGDFAGAQTAHEEALELHRSTSAAEDRIIGDDLRALGETQLAANKLADAIQNLEHALAIHVDVLGPHHRAVAQDLSSLGTALVRSANLIDARRRFREALETYDALGQSDHPDATIIRYIEDQFAGADPDRPRAIKLREMIAIYEQAYGDDHPEVAALSRALGDDRLSTGDAGEAAESYQRALAINERSYGPGHQKVATDHVRLFVAQAAAGENEDAEEHLRAALAAFAALPAHGEKEGFKALAAFDEALDALGAVPAATEQFARIREITRTVEGNDGMLTASALEHLGEELLEARNGVDAMDAVAKARELFAARCGPDHPRLARALHRLGAVLAALQDLEGAKESYEAACGIQDAAATPDQFELLQTLKDLYQVQTALDDRAALTSPAADRHAPRVLNRLGEVAQRIGGPGPLSALADGYTEAGRFEQARDLLLHVLAIVEQIYGPQHLDVAATSNRLGTVCLRLGDPERARQFFESAFAIHLAQYGENNLAVAVDLVFRLAPVRARLGQLDLAIETLERGLVSIARLYGREPQVVRERLIEGWLTLGRSALAAGRGADARAVFALALSRLHADDPVAGFVFHACLGARVAADGEPDEALHNLRAGLRLAIAHEVPDPLWSLVRYAQGATSPTDDSRELGRLLSTLREKMEMEDGIRRIRPQLSGAIPGDWFAKESTTLLAGDGQANVIVSSEPLDENVDSARYSEVQGELLRNEFPGYREISFAPATVFGNRDGFIRHFEWRPDEGAPVTQIQLYHAEPGRGYTATATSPSPHFADVELELRQILDSLRID